MASMWTPFILFYRLEPYCVGCFQ